jgi:hypothetical protein
LSCCILRRLRWNWPLTAEIGRSRHGRELFRGHRRSIADLDGFRRGAEVLAEIRADTSAILDAAVLPRALRRIGLRARTAMSPPRNRPGDVDLGRFLAASSGLVLF